MEYKEIIGFIITVFLGSGGIFAVIKILFPNLGLKNQKKLEIKTEQAKQRINLIQKVIKLEQKANIIEDLQIVHPELFNTEQVNFDQNSIIYMTIMENKENLNNFWNELSSLKREDSVWFSRKVSVYLLYAEKYIVDFYKFLKDINYYETDLYLFGILLAPDIQKWQRKLDDILITELNSVSLEMESHSGDEWKYEKECLEVEYRNTILYKIIHKTDKEILQLMSNVIINYIINVAPNNGAMEKLLDSLAKKEYLIPPTKVQNKL